MKSVKMGIIGCGWFGNVHLDNLLKMEGVSVEALATGNEQRLSDTGAKVPGARQYRDYHEMFEREQLDAVIICVTPERHGDIEQICCEKGIAFYCEKPVGISEEVLQENIRRVKESGILTSVGYQERYNPAIDEIRSMTAEKTAGLAHGSWVGGMPGPLWWRTKASSGGQMVEQTTHIFDMFRYLFGEVKTVYAVGGRKPEFDVMEHDTEDYSTAVLTFASGLTAAIRSASYAQDGVGEVGFQIQFADAQLIYKWNHCYTLKQRTETIHRDIAADSHLTALTAFVQAVGTQDPSGIRCDYEDGARSCLVTLAANRSLETGMPVALQL